MSLLLLASTALFTSQVAPASTSITYFGCYMKGVKVGYRRTVLEPAFWRGQRVGKETSEDHIWMSQGQVREVEVSYSDIVGRNLRTESDLTMLGVNRQSVADYGPSSVRWSSKGIGPDASGTVDFPKDAPLSQSVESTFTLDKATIGESQRPIRVRWHGTQIRERTPRLPWQERYFLWLGRQFHCTTSNRIRTAATAKCFATTRAISFGKSTFMMASSTSKRRKNKLRPSACGRRPGEHGRYLHGSVQREARPTSRTFTTPN